MTTSKEPEDGNLPPSRPAAEKGDLVIFGREAATFKQAATEPTRIAIISYLENQAKAVGEALAGYWNSELIEASAVLQGTITDAKATLKKLKKKKAALAAAAAAAETADEDVDDDGAEEEKQSDQSGDEDEEQAGTRDSRSGTAAASDDDDDDVEVDEDDFYAENTGEDAADENEEEGEDDDEDESSDGSGNYVPDDLIAMGFAEPSEDEEDDDEGAEGEEGEASANSKLYAFKPRDAELASALSLQVYRKVVSGGAVSTADLVALMTERAGSARATFRGYISVIDASASAVSVAELSDAIAKWDHPPEIVIVLQQGERDLAVQYSQLRQHRGTGEIITPSFTRTFPVEEDPPRENLDEDGEDAGLDDDEDDEDEDEEDPNKEDLSLVTPKSKAMPPSKPLTPADVDRCGIITPLQSPTPNAQAADTVVKVLKGARAHLRVLTIDGSAAVSEIVNAITGYLEEHQHRPTHLPKAITVEEAEFSSDAEMLQFVCDAAQINADDDAENAAYDEDEELPKRSPRPSPFGAYCPVAISEGQMVQGLYTNAVLYLGQVFLMSSKKSQARFLLNPSAYVQPPPSFLGRVCIAGNDISACINLARAHAASITSADVSIFNLNDMLVSSEDEGESSPMEGVKTSLASSQSWIAHCKFDALEGLIGELAGTSASPNVVCIMGNCPRPAIPTITVATTESDGDADGSSSKNRASQEDASPVISHEKVTLAEPQDTFAAQQVEIANSLREKGLIAFTVPHTGTEEACVSVSDQIAFHRIFSLMVRPSALEQHVEWDEEEQAVTDVDFNYGDTGRYCPVRLRQKRVLIPGNPDFAALVNGTTYRFANEDLRALFMNAPYEYLSFSAPPEVPPARICFVGPDGSGKRTMAKRLCTKHNLAMCVFDDMVKGLAKKGEAKLAEQEKDREERLALLRAKAAESGDNPDDVDVPELEEDESLESLCMRHLRAPEEVELTPEHAVAVVRDIWAVSRDQGAILIGFPRTAEDLTLMTEEHLFPDVVVNFTLSGHIAQRRLLGAAMAAFKQARDAEQKRREDRDRRKAEAREEKRALFYAEQQKRREAFEADLERRRAEGEDVEDEVFEAEEYEEEDEVDEGEEDVDLETDEEGKERIIAELSEKHENLLDASENVADTAKMEYSINRITVNADAGTPRVFSLLARTLRPYLEDRAGLFETLFFPSVHGAEALLASGACTLTPAFGTWDPVEVFDGKACAPTHALRYPAVYRSNVYYFQTRSARARFAHNPRIYLRQHQTAISPMTPPSSLALFIVGPPKSGKTTLCNWIATRFSVPVLSTATVLEKFAGTHRNTELGQAIRAQLLSGKHVSPDLVCSAITAALNAPEILPRGFVYDMDITTLSTFAKVVRKFERYAVIETTLGMEECIQRAQAQVPAYADIASFTPSKDSAEAISKLCGTYKNEADVLRAHVVQNTRTWCEVDATKSKWHMATAAEGVCLRLLKNHSASVAQRLRRLPEPVAWSCMPTAELQDALSDFGLFCPVRWVDHSELVQSRLLETAFAALYNGRVYKMLGFEEYEKFLRAPQKYASHAPPQDIPEHIDERAVKLLFPSKMAFGGFCPVTFVQGHKRTEALFPGQAQFVASYKNEFFAMKTQAALAEFLKNPYKYNGAVLPPKVPVLIPSVNVTTMTMTSYMDHAVSQIVTKGMTAVGLKRPKYPFISTSSSAQIYLATFLKAHNHGASDVSRRKWQQRLKAFEEAQATLKYVAENTPAVFDDAQPLDLERKLGVLMGMRDRQLNPPAQSTLSSLSSVRSSRAPSAALSARSIRSRGAGTLPPLGRSNNPSASVSRALSAAPMREQPLPHLRPAGPIDDDVVNGKRIQT